MQREKAKTQAAKVVRKELAKEEPSSWVHFWWFGNALEIRVWEQPFCRPSKSKGRVKLVQNDAFHP